MIRVADLPSENPHSSGTRIAEYNGTSDTGENTNFCVSTINESGANSQRRFQRRDVGTYFGFQGFPPDSLNTE